MAHGHVIEFMVPTKSASPEGIIAGPDGNLWFVEYYGNNIGRRTMGGTVTVYPIPASRVRLLFKHFRRSRWRSVVHADRDDKTNRTHRYLWLHHSVLDPNLWSVFHYMGT